MRGLFLLAKYNLDTFSENAALDTEQGYDATISVIATSKSMSLVRKVYRRTHEESKRKAFNGADGSPTGGGMRSRMACNTFSTPLPVFADGWRVAWTFSPYVGPGRHSVSPCVICVASVGDMNSRMWIMSSLIRGCSRSPLYCVFSRIVYN